MLKKNAGEESDSVPLDLFLLVICFTFRTKKSGYLGYIGDIILHSYMGIVVNQDDKDPC